MPDSTKTLDDLINDDQVSLSEYEKENYILEPLLGEIDLIEDEPIRSFTRSVLLRAGAFWDAPSSLSVKFSPPDEHGTGGLILHTKRVVRLTSLMCESFGYLGLERDMVLSAAILHDITKVVQERDEDEPHYDIMYPYTIDRFIKFVRLDDQAHGTDSQSATLYISEDAAMTIMRLIHCHMGPWSPIPETYPVTNLEMLLHLADHIATKLHYIIDGDDLRMERWLLA